METELQIDREIEKERERELQIDRQIEKSAADREK